MKEVHFIKLIPNQWRIVQLSVSIPFKLVMFASNKYPQLGAVKKLS